MNEVGVGTRTFPKDTPIDKKSAYFSIWLSIWPGLNDSEKIT